MNPLSLLLLAGALALALGLPALPAAEPPAPNPETKVLDDTYELTLFAESPQIVTPTGATFTKDGRLLVIESHTHFRQKDYKGPEKDRIRMLEDTDGDGKADKFTTFYEGLKHAMALATGPDESIYVATRGRILQLRDADQDGVADKNGTVEIGRLEGGDYPHNGLCGLTFDAQGQLWFGLGENLGKPYKLVVNGETLKGGGEGGNIYVCQPNGKGLKRMATGFWNPFGLCFDPAGRMFCVDNDPDQTPYCRLLHIVPGGDFGYQFRYGRSGKHPLQAWEGELPAVLPIMAATGEAPCAVIPFDGQLWVTSAWNNRLERFALKPQGASWNSKLEIMVQGGQWFRPVDFAQAPDGSLYITDWVSASYPVHNLGRVWRLARKDGKPANKDWPKLTKAEQQAATNRAQPTLAQLKTDDRFLWQAAVWGLIEKGIPEPTVEELKDPRVRLGILAAARWIGDDWSEVMMAGALTDPDPDVKLTAVRWVADEKLETHRAAVEKIAKEAKPDSALAKGAQAALKYLGTNK